MFAVFDYEDEDDDDEDDYPQTNVVVFSFHTPSAAIPVYISCYSNSKTFRLSQFRQLNMFCHVAEYQS